MDKLQVSDTKTMLFQMSEGSPGALTVLMKLLEIGPRGFMDVLNFDDMGIRGAGIWVAYKDHCGSDIEKLRTALRDRSPELVAAVNAKIHDRKAVTGGASFEHRR